MVIVRMAAVSALVCTVSLLGEPLRTAADETPAGSENSSPSKQPPAAPLVADESTLGTKQNPTPGDVSSTDRSDVAAEEESATALPAELTIEQLFEFIAGRKARRGQPLADALAGQRLIVAAATAIRRDEGVTSAQEADAMLEQAAALRFLGRHDRSSRLAFQQLVDQMKDDDRPAVAKFGQTEFLKRRIATANRVSSAEQKKIVVALRELIGEDLSREEYGLAASLAWRISLTENAELAAGLYLELAERMRQSEEVAMRQRAPRMVGAARRLRLPGEPLDLSGQTAKGAPFEWESYRGKVVLVQFWASWCKRCREANPQLKAALKEYGERGFEIVGISLDRSEVDFDQFVRDEAIPWTNLISDRRRERGWLNPIAIRYGVSAIPASILVGRDGNVISVHAQGEALERLLAIHLPAPESDSPAANANSPARKRATPDSATAADAAVPLGKTRPVSHVSETTAADSGGS